MPAKHAKEFEPAMDIHLQQQLLVYWTRPHSSSGDQSRRSIAIMIVILEYQSRRRLPQLAHYIELILTTIA